MAVSNRGRMGTCQAVPLQLVRRRECLFCSGAHAGQPLYKAPCGSPALSTARGCVGTPARCCWHGLVSEGNERGRTCARASHPCSDCLRLSKKLLPLLHAARLVCSAPHGPRRRQVQQLCPHAATPATAGASHGAAWQATPCRSPHRLTLPALVPHSASCDITAPMAQFWGRLVARCSGKHLAPGRRERLQEVGPLPPTMGTAAAAVPSHLTPPRRGCDVRGDVWRYE